MSPSVLLVLLLGLRSSTGSLPSPRTTYLLMSNTKRIVIFGKTGAGRSSLANTIFGGGELKIYHSLNSVTTKCQANTRSVNGRRITLINTPGLFDTDRSEEEMKPEMMRCITECALGPHAFLIVLKVERFTKHEQEVINKIQEYFSEDALKYAMIVFTHGDQLPEGEKIEDFVSQVEELLNTLDKMTEANQGRCYTNEMLQAVKREIEREEEHVRQSAGNLSQEEVVNEAKKSFIDRLLIRSAGVATGALLGAFLGVAEMVTSDVRSVQDLVEFFQRATVANAALESVVKGGQTGYAAAEGAETTLEAVQKAASAVWSQSGFAADRNNQ